MGLDPVQGLAKRPQYLSQAGAGLHIGTVAPQQARQRVTRVGVARPQRQDGKQQSSLAFEWDESAVGSAHLTAAQKRDAQGCCG